MAGKLIGAVALATQLLKSGKGRAYVMKQLKEKYADFKQTDLGKAFDKAYKDYVEPLPKNKKQTENASAAQSSVKRSRAKTALKSAAIGSGATALYMGSRGDGESELSTRRAEANIKFEPYGKDVKGPPTSVAEAKRRGMDYYIGKDGKKKKAVYAEDVKPKAKPKEKPKAKSKVLSSTDASTSRSYNKGGYVNCGASVPGTHKKK